MKDTYDTYEAPEPQKTDAVLAYEAEQRRSTLRKERDGIAVVSLMAPFWSASDPNSKLARVVRFAPLFCIGAPLLFSAAIALGYI